MQVTPLKSILKSTAAQVETKSRDERNRETALYHANLIQQRKDIQLDILTSMEEMIELPLERSPQYSAPSPSPSDISYFKTALRVYQPNDYDDLIQERNINNHCGYVLCPKPRLKEYDMKKGQYRIIGRSGGACNFRVVDKEELEKWCSADCAKRALYVKVQLSERPAWERANSNTTIELMPEQNTLTERHDEVLADRLGNLKIAENRNQDNLALERGDGNRTTKSGMMDVEIKEKDVVRLVIPPRLDRSIDTHMRLEGYSPQFGIDSEAQVEDEDEDDDMDTDWII